MDTTPMNPLQDAIFNSANFSSIATDEKGVIQIFNVGAERMLGYTAADVVNRITPADISDPQEVIARAKALSVELATPITPGFEALVFKASRGIEDIYELTYIRKDGSRFPAIVSVTALRDADDKIIGYLLIGTDNTARKQAEEALLQAGALQSAIFNSANFSSIATDAKGVIQIFNVGAERMLGYEAADVVNRITPADISDPQELIARAAELSVELDMPITPGFEALVFKASRGIEDIYELTYIRKDGSRFPAVVSVTALRDVGDKIIGYLLIGTDNTARKQIEEARIVERNRFERTLQDKNIELQHASRMKSEFLATMSHELRTPLNAIIGFSEALKDGLVGSVNEGQGEYIADIFNSGQHLLSLINDILDLSKIEAGMMALELEPVDLDSLLSNSLSIVREKAAAQRIRLESETEAGLGSPELDMRKTKQVVYNLLSNAVKFSAQGGRVELSARRVSRDTVGNMTGDWPAYTFPLADSEHQQFIEICVSDQGIGIASESLPKLFQAFTQIDSGLARKFEGTGLGLAMVRQLVELHGGTVAVASAEGEGTCVCVWLPERSPAASAALSTRALSGAAFSAATISAAANSAVAFNAITAAPMERFALVIEDDERAMELIRLMLEAEGFTVLNAESAEIALELLEQHVFSLITLDLLLPGMDGWEFLEVVRENPTMAKVPVVIIAGVLDISLALSSGAAAALQKPISRAQLKNSLASLGLHPAREHSYNVLVVDDDPKAVEVIAAFLPAPAYIVVRAFGGREAISLARQSPPDLILLDLIMPDVNGFDVVQALQRDLDTARVPILVVTAKRITLFDREALNSYADKVIHIVEKAGFNRALFIAEVRRALQPA
jgi:signal transduction histidine kinase/CheY-like chemotaxis protein